jgi:hypothetical protein
MVLDSLFQILSYYIIYLILNISLNFRESIIIIHEKITIYL